MHVEWRNADVTPRSIKDDCCELDSNSLSVSKLHIAAFLDRETAKIDALVAKKERLIELLQEKRAALITRAVTKGLPSIGSGQATPNVPMKDSGVEWLGEIPAHWEVKRLKQDYCFASAMREDFQSFHLLDVSE